MSIDSLRDPFEGVEGNRTPLGLVRMFDWDRAHEGLGEYFIPTEQYARLHYQFLESNGESVNPVHHRRDWNGAQLPDPSTFDRWFEQHPPRFF